MRGGFAAPVGLCVVAMGAVAAEPGAHADDAMPRGFVYLSEVDASIAQDIRYATRANFTGSPVDGYEAGACILTRRTAEALARAQRALAEKDAGLTLKVYDCYRPLRAVARFAGWAGNAAQKDSRGYSHPALRRRDLFPLGYIARTSGHSRGNVVDLTIASKERAQTPPAAAPLPVLPSTCTGPVNEREADSTLDMGTAFDCFDTKAHTSAPGLTAGMRRARLLLVEVMREAGFRNYAKEWWHFGHPAGDSGSAHDFVVRAPTAANKPR
jgi:zinc D-Ala-D-Ala dipeptidase